VGAFSTTHAIQRLALVPILMLCQALIRSSEHHNNKQDPAVGSIYVCAKGVVSDYPVRLFREHARLISALRFSWELHTGELQDSAWAIGCKRGQTCSTTSER